MDTSDFIDLDPIPLHYQSKQLCLSEFVDLEDFTFDHASSENNFDLFLHENNSAVDPMPLNTIMPTPAAPTELSEAPLLIEDKLLSSGKKEKKREERPCRSKKKATTLEFENIRKHFGFPINEAAWKMKVGLSFLKRRCRELNIKRWPYRKIKSLNALISNVKEMGLRKEVAALEKQKMLVEQLPDTKLDEDTKKLRQTCFKSNYVIRKSSYIGSGKKTYNKRLAVCTLDLEKKERMKLPGNFSHTIKGNSSQY